MVVKLLQYVICACFLLVATHASAQDADLAKSEYQEGWKALKAKNYAKALTHYQKSYSEMPRPRTMYNIALCEEATGRYEGAVEHYQQFLIEAQSRDADFLKLARAKLKALRTRIGAILKIDSDPPGASVRVNGKVKGHTPLRLDLLEGEHLIRVSHKGTRSTERQINIQAGENLTEYFTLEAVGSVAISVTPADAQIRRVDVDDHATGLYEANLSPGRYKFEVSLMGYKTRTLSLVIDASSNIQKTVRLQAQSSTGTVTLRSDLSGANVTIDGIIVGATRRREGEEIPTLERRLSAGNHMIIVEAKNHESWSKRFQLARGETLSVDIKFKGEGTPRRYARWGLNAAGAVAIVAGLALGALAIKDVKSDEQENHDRGKRRANRADVLLGVGAVSLVGAWYLNSKHTQVTLERNQEGEKEVSSAALEEDPRPGMQLLPEQRLWVYGLPNAANVQTKL